MVKKTKQCCLKDSGPSAKKSKVHVNTEDATEILAAIEGNTLERNDATEILAAIEGNALERNDVAVITHAVEENVAIVENVASEANTIERGFETQCRPNGLNKLIDSMTAKQKEDVRSIGFGGILELKLNTCSNIKMLKWLVDNFNSSSRVLYIDSHRFFAITADDVYDVFMVPRNEGSSVVKYTRNEDGSNMCIHIKEKYKVGPNTSVSVLHGVLKELGEGGEDFKRLFVLYYMCSFLTPSRNRKVTTGVVKSLEDISRISKLDWCSFILDHLCDFVSSFKKQTSKYLGGCILLLQFVYLHRLKWRGVAVPCTLPLIKHWTNENIRNRCLEEEHAGFFGSGELCSGFPLTLNGQLKSNCSQPESDDVENNFGDNTDHDWQEMKDLLVSFKKDANDTEGCEGKDHCKYTFI